MPIKTYTPGIVILWVMVLLFGCQVPRHAGADKTTSLANSLLWKIESPDLDAPSYLFGTMHLIPEEHYFWPAHFQNAYSATEQIVLETNELDMNPASMMGLMPKIMMPQDQTLEDLVSDDEYERIREFFEGMGMPLMFLQNIKPFFLYMLVDIDLGSLLGEGSKSYEMEITNRAKTDRKAVLGLESLDYQISLFDSIPYTDQAQMLVQAIDQKMERGDESADEAVQGLYQTYKDQDLNAILEEVQATDITFKNFNQIFLDIRNRNWIPRIETYIHQKPTFIAVGAAHLPGQTGVIHLLEKAGYILTPVLNPRDGTY